MKNFKGFLWAIISSATFGFIPLFSIPLLKSGVALESLCFYRFIIATLFMSGFLLYKKISFKLSIKEGVILGSLSLFYASTSLFLTASYPYIPSGVATTIHFLYPVLVATVMMLFFKEKITFIKTISIVLALMGVFCLCGLGIGGDFIISIKGLIFVIITIITYSTYIIGVNNSKVLHNMNGMRMTFYVLAFSALYFFINLLAHGANFSPIVGREDWINIICLALLPTLISDLTLIYAIKIIGSTNTAILGCMEPLTAVTIGVLVFGERLSIYQGVGVLLVFIAVYLIITAKKR